MKAVRINKRTKHHVLTGNNSQISLKKQPQSWVNSNYSMFNFIKLPKYRSNSIKFLFAARAEKTDILNVFSNPVAWSSGKEWKSQIFLVNVSVRCFSINLKICKPNKRLYYWLIKCVNEIPGLPLGLPCDVVRDVAIHK